MKPGTGEPDVLAYQEASAECFEVFLERRKIYGDHTARHRIYHRSGLHVKLDRAVKDLEANREIRRDTLVDLVCFATMLLSVSEKEECDKPSDHHQ